MHLVWWGQFYPPPIQNNDFCIIYPKRIKVPVFHGMALQNSWRLFKAISSWLCKIFSSVRYILPQFSVLSITTFVAFAAPCEFQGWCLSRLTIGGTILQVAFEISDGNVENQIWRLLVSYCVKVKTIVKWR